MKSSTAKVRDVTTLIIQENGEEKKKRGKGVRLFSSSSSVRGQQTGMRGGDEDIPQPKQSITILNTRAIFNRAIHTSSSSSFFSFLLFLSFFLPGLKRLDAQDFYRYSHYVYIYVYI
jgi:hypothetical protein